MRRMTPLQALSHPFITGEFNVQLPFNPYPDYQLQTIRQAQENIFRIQQQFHQVQLGNRNAYEQIQFNNDYVKPYMFSEIYIKGQIAAQQLMQEIKRSGGILTMSNFFSVVQQKNSLESFRPPIYALPEQFFYGNCCKILAEFLEESRIRFQIHQDDMKQAQQMLEIQNYKNIFSDVLVDSEYFSNLKPFQTQNKKLSSQVIFSKDMQFQNPLLQAERQKSMKQIAQDDKTILQPISHKLSENEDQHSFIRQFGNTLYATQLLKENQKGSICEVKKYKTTKEFELQYFDDFFIGPDQDKYKPIKREEYDDKESKEEIKKEASTQKQQASNLKPHIHLFSDKAVQASSLKLQLNFKVENSNYDNNSYEQESPRSSLFTSQKNHQINQKINESNDFAQLKSLQVGLRSPFRNHAAKGNKRRRDVMTSTSPAHSVIVPPCGNLLQQYSEQQKNSSIVTLGTIGHEAEAAFDEKGELAIPYDENDEAEDSDTMLKKLNLHFLNDDSDQEQDKRKYLSAKQDQELLVNQKSKFLTNFSSGHQGQSSKTKMVSGDIKKKSFQNQRDQLHADSSEPEQALNNVRSDIETVQDSDYASAGGELNTRSLDDFDDEINRKNNNESFEDGPQQPSVVTCEQSGQTKEKNETKEKNQKVLNFKKRAKRSKKQKQTMK